jgi:hypothetical protein
MKKLVYIILFICFLAKADTTNLYSKKLQEKVKSSLPIDSQFYINGVQESGNYYFVTIVECYDNKPSHPHLFVFDSKLNSVKDIVIEDFSYHRDLVLEDIDGDKVSDVVLMTGTGANSNRIDVFLNKLKQKSELDKVFSTTGNHALRFYVAKGMSTIEIGGGRNISSSQRTILIWNGKTFVRDGEKK